MKSQDATWQLCLLQVKQVSYIRHGRILSPSSIDQDAILLTWFCLQYYLLIVELLNRERGTFLS